MNRTKHLLALALAVMLLCTLTACARKPNEKTDWVWSGYANQDGALSEVGYYYVSLQNSLLSYAELSGEGSVILCSKAGCTHNGENCEAWVGGFYRDLLFYGNDHIYYLVPNTQVLCRRDATGIELAEIGVPGEQFYKEQKSVSIGTYAPVGKYLYYAASVTGKVYDQENNEESGQQVTATVNYYIGRFHLDSGKDEILFEKTDLKNGGTLRLLAAKDGVALFIMKEGIDLSAEDPGYTEALRQSPVTLCRWDAQTGKTEELFQKQYQDCSEWQIVYDGKLYYATRADREANHRGSVYAYDLTTGEEELVCENGFFTHLGGGYALRKTNDEEGWLLIELKTGKTLPKDIGSALPICCEASEEGFVVNRLQTKLFEKDDGTTELIKERVYSYVTYASLSDGWQEADMVTLYVQKLGG